MIIFVIKKSFGMGAASDRIGPSQTGKKGIAMHQGHVSAWGNLRIQTRAWGQKLLVFLFVLLPVAAHAKGYHSFIDAGGNRTPESGIFITAHGLENLSRGFNGTGDSDNVPAGLTTGNKNNQTINHAYDARGLLRPTVRRKAEGKVPADPVYREISSLETMGDKPARGEVSQERGYVRDNAAREVDPDLQPLRFAGGGYEIDIGLLESGMGGYGTEIDKWSIKHPILFDEGNTELYGYTLQSPVDLIHSLGLLTGTLGGSIRIPGWITWILERLGLVGDDFMGQGGAAGIAFQLTDKCGNFSPDLGFYVSIAGEGGDFGIGRISVNLGLRRGAIADQGGKGADISAQYGAFGGSVLLTSDNRFSGGSIDFGLGFNLGIANTVSRTWSVRQALSALFSGSQQQECAC